MFKVKCIRQFVDKKNNLMRHIGDVWEVDADRLKDLTVGGLGAVVEVLSEIQEDKNGAPDTEKKPRKRAKK